MVDLLDTLPEIERVGLMNYKNVNGFPWIDLTLAKGQAGNFHCFDNTWHEEFNLISVVCSKTENEAVPAAQIIFLIELAKKLGWELVKEENDSSEETDIVIWKPL
ncbi:hypothetical protein [Hymenobacter negativus]|uniref:Uncharacterized protein n=1 Tax=Hymenobacter negativus TaxID=2795026 RepID=A0ABS3QJV4_9BACT|nr:hypothetical protein [Hymenobacter negativus]MBO2011533.1 hypothetical protein [Hymenobacter negativus]